MLRFVSLLLLALTVSMQVNHGKGADLTDLNTFTDKTAEIIGVTGTVLMKAKDIAEKLVAMADFCGPVGGIIAGLVNVFVPKPKSPELVAIEKLTTIVNERFDQLGEQLQTAVTEIELFVEMAFWNDRVTNPMMKLKYNAAEFFKRNMSKAGADALSSLCKDNQLSPFSIATHIWSHIGAGCEGNTETLLQGVICDEKDPDYHPGNPCVQLPTQCLIQKYFESKQYDHSAAEAMLTLVTNTMLELTTYHAICLNITWVTQDAIDYHNGLFIARLKEISEGTPKYIESKMEEYWPDHAQKYAQSFIKGIDINKHRREIFRAFNTRYSWYHHIAEVEMSDDHAVEWVTSRKHVIMNLKVTEQESQQDRLFIMRYRVVNDGDMLKTQVAYDKTLEWLNSPFTRNPTYTNEQTLSVMLRMVSNGTPTKTIKNLKETFSGNFLPAGGFKNYVVYHMVYNNGYPWTTNTTFRDCRGNMCVLKWQGPHTNLLLFP